MVREWDPATASTAEIQAVLRVFNDVAAVDVPSDPPWREDKFRDYLAVTMPGERRTSWLAIGGDGEVVGHASLLLLEDIGVLELSVGPKARHGDAGSYLLAAVARCAADAGYESLGVEVIGGTPSVAFFEEHGFRCAYVEVRNVLDLAGVDWPRLGEMAAGIGAGYLVEYYPGGPPESQYAAYAAAKDAARQPGFGDLELRPSSYDAERLSASIATLHARGLKPYVVVAVHEQSEAIAGLTEVVVPAQRPTRAEEYDTVVMPAHRGYGVGRAIKARMLFELRAAEPHLLDVQTWNAMEHEPMLKVNTDLGFKPDRQWREYEADVTDITRRLDALRLGEH